MIDVHGLPNDLLAGKAIFAAVFGSFMNKADYRRPGRFTHPGQSYHSATLCNRVR